jgi:iron complex transport system ATP-binding protein
MGFIFLQNMLYLSNFQNILFNKEVAMLVLNFEDIQLIRQQQVLLESINWQIHQKQHWALLGLNGAGKSLLLQLIIGKIWPSSGKRQVLGETFGKTSVPVLQRRIGWVSAALQETIPQSDCTEKIVLSGKFASLGIYETYHETDLTEAKAILSSLGAKHLIGRRFSNLSQGERQLVLIGRALMTKPELLILDEPCNGLDLFAREELLRRIESMARNGSPTLIYVTHHTEEILPIFDHILMLKNGNVHASGKRQQVFTEQILSNFYEKPVYFHRFSPNRLAVLPVSNS